MSGLTIPTTPLGRCVRGKHQKEVNCSGCKGYGTVEHSRDGEVIQVPCTLCNGTGKQPS